MDICYVLEGWPGILDSTAKETRRCMQLAWFLKSRNSRSATLRRVPLRSLDKHDARQAGKRWSSSRWCSGERPLASAVPMSTTEMAQPLPRGGTTHPPCTARWICKSGRQQNSDANAGHLHRNRIAHPIISRHAFLQSGGLSTSKPHAMHNPYLQSASTELCKSRTYHATRPEDGSSRCDCQAPSAGLLAPVHLLNHLRSAHAAAE